MGGEGYDHQDRPQESRTLRKKDLSQVVEAMKVVDPAMVTSTRLERLD